jgi:hypothetical protein
MDRASVTTLHAIAGGQDVPFKSLADIQHCNLQSSCPLYPESGHSTV